MINQLTYFTRFLPTTDRGGGSRRMMQIWELAKTTGIPCQVVSSQRKDFISAEAAKRIDESPPDKECLLWSDKRRKSVFRLKEISREWAGKIIPSDSLSIALMDDPIYFEPLFEKLEGNNIPIIAVCHNLESLAPEQVECDPSRDLLMKELDLLSRCRTVITISREETFLLNNMGIHTSHIPYYPIKPILERLQKVRLERKKNSTKKGILLLGNVLNVQNQQGMRIAVEHWAANNLFQKHGKLLVAGYGTDIYLDNIIPGDAADFLGPLSNEELDALLAQVKACLCYQETGAGALTRICELLIAGVPILANSHAARSYHNHTGVIEFPDLDDIEEGISRVDGTEGHIPIPRKPEDSRLSTEIKSILDN